MMISVLKILILVLANQAVTNALRLENLGSHSTYAPRCEADLQRAEAQLSAKAYHRGEDYCVKKEWPHENGFRLDQLNPEEFAYALKPDMLRSGWVPGKLFRMGRILKKIQNQEVIEVAVLGGSFTLGHGCGETTEQGEMACSWPTRLGKRLQTIFGNSINVQNLAESGTTSAELLNRLGTITPFHAIDLLIIDTLTNDAEVGEIATVGYEKLVRAIHSVFPDAQFLLVEDGCPRCLSDKAMLRQRRQIAQHYGIPVMDYAAMVEGYNNVGLDSNLLWPETLPEMDEQNVFVKVGPFWPKFLPHVNTTRATCCPLNHPPWPVHEYMADAVMHAFHEMLGDSCDGLSSDGKHSEVQVLPEPLNDQKELDRYSACLHPLTFYDARSHYVERDQPQPNVVSGDWKVCEDRPGRPGWIATRQGSTIKFPVRFGTQGILAVTYLRSYEHFGTAKLQFQIEQHFPAVVSFMLHGEWEKNFSLPVTTAFIAYMPGQSGGFLYQLAKKDNWQTKPKDGDYNNPQFVDNHDYELQISLESGSKFKILGVASC
jgi:hypothetical protein